MELAELGEQVFAVERILKKRYRRGKIEFLVKWKDWSDRYNSWEPKDNILDQRLIFEFNSRYHGEFGEPRKGRKPRKRRFSQDTCKTNDAVSPHDDGGQTRGGVSGDRTIHDAPLYRRSSDQSVGVLALVNGEDSLVGGDEETCVGENRENGGVYQTATKHVYGVGRNGGSLVEHGHSGVNETGAVTAATTGQHRVPETEMADADGTVSQKSPLDIASKVQTSMTSSFRDDRRSPEGSWRSPMLRQRNSQSGDVQQTTLATEKQRSTRYEPVSPKSDQENISIDPVNDTIQEQSAASAPKSYRTLTPLHLWQPKKECSLAVIDSVAITDVTAQNFTVTIRESNTDVGFFRFRNDVVKVVEQGGSTFQDDRKTTRDDGEVLIDVSGKQTGKAENAKDEGKAENAKGCEKTEISLGTEEDERPTKEAQPTTENGDEEPAELSPSKFDQDTDRSKGSKLTEEVDSCENCGIEQAKDQNANELFTVEKDVKMEVTEELGRENCSKEEVCKIVEVDAGY
ncbi:chromobox protein homolog 8-like [Ptychodera flava]|uniref:chromobox protein homolog 8-like n=1 Tax=Ptychodera flava TaxID=63121 RepID=UPI003969DF57